MPKYTVEQLADIILNDPDLKGEIQDHFENYKDFILTKGFSNMDLEESVGKSLSSLLKTPLESYEKIDAVQTAIEMMYDIDTYYDEVNEWYDEYTKIMSSFPSILHKKKAQRIKESTRLRHVERA